MVDNFDQLNPAISIQGFDCDNAQLLALMDFILRVRATPFMYHYVVNHTDVRKYQQTNLKTNLKQVKNIMLTPLFLQHPT